MQNVYTIIKKIRTGIILNLESWDFSSQPRVIKMPADTKQLRISRAHALGIFTNPIALKYFKKGYFIIKEAEEFKKDYESVFFPLEQTKFLSVEETEELLKNGDISKIQSAIKNKEVDKKQIIAVAIDILSEIKLNVINFLEQKYSIDLSTRD